VPTEEKMIIARAEKKYIVISEADWILFRLLTYSGHSEFDHRIRKSLFDIFDQWKNGKEQGPDAHFLDSWKDFFSQDNITDDTKAMRKIGSAGWKKRMNPEKRILI